jgi:hypothetical protein
MPPGLRSAAFFIARAIGHWFLPASLPGQDRDILLIYLQKSPYLTKNDPITGPHR